jgi:hypothetical protein
MAEKMKKCFELNRHFITIFVVLGCLTRIAYIYTTDLYPVSTDNDFRFYSYGLRAANEVLWFTAFAYLAFYWRELQLAGIRQNILNVDKTKSKMYGTIACFTILRLGRAICEGFDLKLFVFVVKGTCSVYMVAFFIYLWYWGSKLLGRLKSMNQRTTTQKQTKGSKKKKAALR